MAVIQQYEDRTVAQGQVNSQAAPEDFGAGLGASIRQVGDVGMSIAERMHENDVMDEVTLAHQLASKKHVEWEQQYIDRTNAATPGDRTFAPKLIDDIKTDMEQSSGLFKTRKAQNVFAELTGKLENSFGARAINTQSHLDGQAVKQEFAATVEDESKLVNGNDLNLKSSLGRVTAMIDDPSSGYSRVPQTVRNELKSLATQALATSSVEGYFARDIYAAAKKLLPDQVTEAYASTLKPMADTVTAQAGKIAATVAPAVKDFVGSVFDALVQRESGGVHTKDGKLVTSSAGALGITQVMPRTGAKPGYGVAPLKNQSAEEYLRFGKDYLGAMYKEFGGAADKALAAYNAGPGAVKEALKSGADWLSKLPAETQNYVAKLLPVANDQAAAPSQAPTDVASPPPTDAQGIPLPQLKIPKDATLMPPQGVDIPGWNELKLDTQQKFMGILVRDFNSRVTVDRATLADDRKNMEANLLAGNKYDGLPALQARYAQAYGPEMAARMIKEDAVTRDLGQFTSGLRGRSMEEIGAAIGPAPKDNATAGEYAAYQRKMDAVKADRAEFQKSPVDYVARYSPAVQRAMQEAQNASVLADKQPNPTNTEAAAVATQRMITASLAEQRRLGAANPTILSEAAEKQLTQKLENILGSGRDVAQGIDNIYKSYGSYGPTVAAQMAPKIGGLMNVLGSGIDPSAATLLVEAHRNKEEYKRTISPDKLKDLDVTVQGAMSKYSESLRGVPNGSNVQANYQEQISNLAMARMSKLGESQTEAVQQAYKALVADQYNFQDGYRVPVALDAQSVGRQANTFKNQIQASDVSLLPGSMGNPDDRMQAQLSAIRNYGKWVTSAQQGADGKSQEGLTLMVPTPGGYAPVPAPDGKPIFRSFGQLLLDDKAAQELHEQTVGTYDRSRRYDALGRLRNPSANK